MDVPSFDGPQPPMSRTGLVLGLYGAVSLTAILISAGREDVDIYRIEGTSTPLGLIVSPLLGAAVALIVVLLSRLAVRYLETGRKLHRDFRSLLGSLTSREILILALASAIGEELLFRGALQPWLGVWAQAALFTLFHIGPRRHFWLWTASAFALALTFGYMFAWTGDLGGPIVAHFTINYLNLHFIARTDIPDTPRPTPA